MRPNNRNRSDTSWASLQRDEQTQSEAEDAADLGGSNPRSARLPNAQTKLAILTAC
jgi:hypothetical protein